jgi:ATP-dependent RNA helicase RhlE
MRPRGIKRRTEYMPFDQLGLKPELLRAISARGYKRTTPIQAKSIPKILEGRDILAGAQTGTGKTAAFALPIIQLLSEKANKGRTPRALILTPTRELAAQILEFIEAYGKSLTLRSAVVFGGVSIVPQIDKLRRGVDILVATPGRLLDHAGQKTVNLSHVEILVLDEADRMLDMGFINDIRKIIKLLPHKRQNLLFSATYSEDIKRLADGILHNPELIEVATRNTTAETVLQVVHPVARSRKRDLLAKLIKDGKWNQVLVFTRTKHGANRLAKQLMTDHITAVAIHGNKSQGARTSALADFKKGAVRVLVATDIAARGLDITLLPHVVNYELPDTPESYVHRIGRTGRAGADGKAISLVSPEEAKELRAIQKLLGRVLPVEKIEGFDAPALHEVHTQRPHNVSRDKERGSRAHKTEGYRGARSHGSEKTPSSFTPRGERRSFAPRGKSSEGRSINGVQGRSQSHSDRKDHPRAAHSPRQGTHSSRSRG